MPPAAAIMFAAVGQKFFMNYNDIGVIVFKGCDFYPLLLGLIKTGCEIVYTVVIEIVFNPFLCLNIPG